MAVVLICKDCVHWEGSPSSFSAGCRLKVYTSLVAFDRCDPPCPSHSSAPAPAVDMQSQARGVPAGMGIWGGIHKP